MPVVECELAGPVWPVRVQPADAISLCHATGLEGGVQRMVV